MSVNDAGGCGRCGAPLAPDAAACAACGALVPRPGPAVDPRRGAVAVVLAVVGGLASGPVVAVPYLALLLATGVKFNGATPTSATTLVLVFHAVSLIAFMLGGIWLAARRSPVVGIYVITTAIIASVPVGACDAILLASNH